MDKRKCIVYELGGCSPKLSREHWFSESILLLIAGSKNELMVQGAPWYPQGEKATSPDGLASKILCTHHNSQLSYLDSEALRLFTTLRYETSEQSVEIDGAVLERWCLKVLIGMAMAWHRLRPSTEWLEVLYGLRPFPPGTGLMVPVSGKHRSIYNCFDCVLHFDDEQLKTVGGLWLCVSWVPLYLCTIPGIGPEDKQFLYRPSQIAMNFPGKRKVANLGGNGMSAGFVLQVPIET